MFPLPTNPKVVLLLDDNDQIVGVASNIAPLGELKVEVTRSERIYNDLVRGVPFATGTFAEQRAENFTLTPPSAQPIPFGAFQELSDDPLPRSHPGSW